MLATRDVSVEFGKLLCRIRILMELILLLKICDFSVFYHLEMYFNILAIERYFCQQFTVASLVIFIRLVRLMYCYL